MRHRSSAVVLAATALAMTTPTLAKHASSAFTGHEFLNEARVNLAHARANALKARPGKITDYELEKEAGGSGLRYSFDIRSGAKKYEVGIDAANGAILENKIEGAHPD